MQCRHFGSCGSCGLFDLSYSDQLTQKKDRVSKLLKKFYGDELLVFDSPQEHYRARAEFRIWHRGDRCSYGMGNLSRDGIVCIEECPKVIKPIEKRMWSLLDNINNNKALSRKLFAIEFLSATTDECLTTMIYHRRLDSEWEESAKQLEQELDIHIIGRSRKQKIVTSQEFIGERLTIDNTVYIYRYYEGGFTQPNPFANSKMIEWVISSISADIRIDILESYCGLGNFTIPLSKLFTKVLATEISKNSIKAAKENCKLNSIENISFARLSSEEMTEALNKKREFRRLSDIDLNSYSFSHVLIDPPRAGLDKGTIDLISRIDNIIYISCNPETLARDLEMLTSTHKVDTAAIFDQFPHTSHIESGVILRRKT